MRIMKMNEKFKIAESKATEVINLLNYDAKDMVDTDKVKEIVEELTGIEINVASVSFSSASINASFGAMMRVENIENTKKAFIILNKDRDAMFRRFSFVHELGHIIADKYNFYEDKKHYTISAHINYKITSLTEDECIDEHLINEQVANIFALLVLMPSKAFFEKIRSSGDIDETAMFFGITSDAVISRIQLGESNG